MNDLLKSYLQTRQQTEHLCRHLHPEDYTPQSALFASPPKWHIAHTTWFFEEMILKHHVPDYQIFHQDFSFLFNSYYNTIGERLARDNRGLITRPSVEKVFEYRAYVDKQMTHLLQNNSSEDISKLVILGINHEQQHQELLVTDIKYTLSRNPIYPKLSEEDHIVHNSNNSEWLSLPEGIFEIGHAGDGFCFDNELGRHRVFQEPFQIKNTLVTYGDYMAFIEDDGYKKASLWLDEAWQWLQTNNIQQPLYWIRKDDQWYHYTLSGLKSIDSEAILTHVSYFEAAAFAQWCDCRLPTEFEWEVASKEFDWGQRWEWTNSAYLPYPNFKIADGAVGEYNGKFMSNQMVLRGGSTATAQGHSRATYRNFFPSDTQWQFSGIRLAK